MNNDNLFFFFPPPLPSLFSIDRCLPSTLSIKWSFTRKAALKKHGYSLETTKGDGGWDRWHAAVARAYVVWGTAAWAADTEMQATLTLALKARSAIGAASTVLAVLPHGTATADAPMPWGGDAAAASGSAGMGAESAAVGGCVEAGCWEELIAKLQDLSIEPSSATYTATDNVEHVPVDVTEDGAIGISLASDGPVHRILSINPTLCR